MKIQEKCAFYFFSTKPPRGRVKHAIHGKSRISQNASFWQDLRNYHKCAQKRNIHITLANDIYRMSLGARNGKMQYIPLFRRPNLIQSVKGTGRKIKNDKGELLFKKVPSHAL